MSENGARKVRAVSVSNSGQFRLAPSLSTDRPYDNTGRALEAMHPADRVVASDVLGRISFWAPDVRFTDPLGLNEPEVAATRERGDYFGKRNDAITADRHPVVVASNYWIGMDSLYQAGRDRGEDYVAVVNPGLTEDRVFLLVERAWSSRLIDALRPYYGALSSSVEYEPARARWQTRFPKGQ